MNAQPKERPKQRAVLCRTCAKEFSRPESQLTGRTDYFCSRICYLTYHSRDRETRKCLICGNEFTCGRGEARKYCSRDCYRQDFNPTNFDPSHFQGIFHSTKAGAVPYDSSYEFRRMHDLDSDPSVVAWKRCEDKIKWIDAAGDEHFYHPDFRIEYANGLVVVEECKGWVNDAAERKAAAARAFYSTSEVLYRMVQGFDELSPPPLLESYDNTYGKFERPTMEYVWMRMACQLADRSTCLRRKVGAVLTDKNMSMAASLGYNGDWAGGDNQCQSLEPGLCQCTHAEINALTKARLPLEDGVLFVSMAPCRDCSQVAISRGVSKVIYFQPYRKETGIRLLRSAGVEVYRFNDLFLGQFEDR